MKNQITFLLLSFISIHVMYANDFNQQKADSLFYKHQQMNGPGLVISVHRNNQFMYQNHVGFSNMEHQIPISDSSVFLVGSISKQFTSYAILLLEKEGKLDLNDVITKYLPELKSLKRNITIRQLANHTSGFRNTDDLNNLRGRSDQDLIGQEEMVAVLLRQKGLNFDPGEQFQYVNSGYVLLAEIVHRVSGVSFSDFVKTNIFDPMGMKNSQFMEDPTMIIKNEVRSYYLEGGEYHYFPKNRSIVGSTGLYTTTQDLIIWNRNFLNKSQEVSGLMAKMIAPSKLNSGGSIPYGLGQETKMYRGVKVIFHGGGDAGFRAYSLSIPAYDFSLAITGNFESFNPLNLAFGMIDIFLAKELDPKPRRAAPTIKAKQLHKFCGDYQIFPGFYISIISKHDSLFFQSFGTNTSLYLPAISSNEFTFPGMAHSKIVFMENNLEWHFSDFMYPGKKGVVTAPLYKDIKIMDYLGSFYSNELETMYTFVSIKGKIIATHPINPDVVLTPIAKDAFITDAAYLGRITFVRNENGVVGCQISAQTAYGNSFNKIRLKPVK